MTRRKRTNGAGARVPSGWLSLASPVDVAHFMARLSLRESFRRIQSVGKELDTPLRRVLRVRFFVSQRRLCYEIATRPTFARRVALALEQSARLFLEVYAAYARAVRR